MSEEDEERKREDRRAWLGDPIEHGGGYRPSRGPEWVPQAGCCALEAFGSAALLLGLASFSFYSLLS